MVAQSIRTIKIFYCYVQEDEALREELAKHLSPFRRLRYITGWYKRDIQAGTDWEKESRTHLDAANIILLLLSADFFASDYHYAVEMERAIRKHKAGTAHVIPILLRPVDWRETSIGELSALPVNEKPVTQWANRDEAWLNVVQGIREVIRDLLQKQPLSSEENDVLYPEQGPLSGQIVGNKYLLGELLGEGGFSQVYKAQHIEMQRQQAIKVLHEHHFRKPQFRNRFLREAQTIASLDHSHIIHLNDFWTEASQAYLVMPFISGGTLQGILDKQQGFLERDQIVFYLECICAALDYAHEKGIAHLDLKPLNLLVHEDGRLLLSDFGLAHLIKQGVIIGGSSLRVGTPHYMAPEHITGSPERRSDLFSLGVILYQMLMGRLPFDGSLHETILLKNMTEWPPAPRALRPELPQAVETMLGKALAKQPEQRYQTANEFLIAFKKAITATHQSKSLHNIVPDMRLDVSDRSNEVIPNSDSVLSIPSALDPPPNPIAPMLGVNNSDPKEQRPQPLLIPPATLEESTSPRTRSTEQKRASANKAADDDLSNRKHLLKGYQHQLVGDYDEAMQEYRIILRNAPELLGEVVSNVRALLKLAPKYHEGYRLLGDAYMKQGEYLQAMKSYDKALKMAKVNKRTQQEDQRNKDMLAPDDTVPGTNG